MPKVSWEEGVLQTIRWYAENRERWIGRVDWLPTGALASLDADELGCSSPAAAASSARTSSSGSRRTGTTSPCRDGADFDLTDMAQTARLFDEAKPELVFHLAAEVGGIGANRANPGRYWYANLMMGAHVLEQARLHGTREARHRRHGLRLPEVHAGAVPRGRPLERLSRRRRTPRTASRRRRCSSARRPTASSTASTRSSCCPTNLYGPRDNFDLETSHVIPALIRKMVESPRARSSLWGDGSPTREFLYVDDCVEGLVLAAERYDGAEPVNLGTGVETSIREPAEIVAEAVGFTRRDPLGHARCRTASRAARSTRPAPRSCSASGPACRCARGSQRTVAWYREHGRPHAPS